MPIIDRNDPLSWPIGWSPAPTFDELVAKISSIRSQVEELAQDFRTLWEQPGGPDIAGELYEALEDVANDLAELEGEPEEPPAPTHGIFYDV